MTIGSALDLFRRASGTAAAIIYFDQVLDYASLDELSDRLARAWQARGVRAGDRVALVLQNTPAFALGTLAAWKLAALPVTLNPMYRVAELQRLFGDCTPRLVVCHDDQFDAIVEAGRGVFDAGQVYWSRAGEFQRRDDGRVLPAATPAPDAQALALSWAADMPGGEFAARVGDATGAPGEPGADDAGLLLYTSGTTGVPKAAMLTHRNLVHNAQMACRELSLDGDSRIFGLAPLFHITGFELQWMAALAAGAALVLTYRFQPAVALDAFVEHHPTFMVGAITAFIALMNQPQAGPEHLASFHHLYSGGAPIAPATIDAFAQRFGRSIRSSYGMTELTAPSHLAPVDGPIPVDPASGALSIGRATPGTDVIVVDEAGRPVPDGTHGELLVRGPQVMAGYWNKPAETAQALAGGWMHTGDVGFRDAAGWYYLIDRKKDMISASGFKVWPREVEDVLYAYDGVREAAVVGVPDPYRGETVIAFVSAAAGVTLDPAAITRHCRERLAAYKCPTSIGVLDELPKTVSGKITRNTLARDWLAARADPGFKTTGGS